MNKVAIAQALHGYYEARDRYAAARLEVVKLAVECGQMQKDAYRSAPEYLDGYLAGQGALPAARVA